MRRAPVADPESPKQKPSTTGSPFIDAQVIDIGIYEAALRASTSWRRASFSLIALAFLLIVAVLILATKDHTEAVVYKEDKSGDIALIGLSSNNRSPSEASITAQLASWIMAVRDIPGSDNELIQRNAFIATYMLNRGSAAYDKYLQFVHDSNPITLAQKGYRRTVPVGGVEVDKLTLLTYRIAWKEQLAQGTTSKPQLDTYVGTVTLAQPPAVPNDPLIGQYNPAGVYITDFDMKWSILR